MHHRLGILKTHGKTQVQINWEPMALPILTSQSLVTRKPVRFQTPSARGSMKKHIVRSAVPWLLAQESTTILIK